MLGGPTLRRRPVPSRSPKPQLEDPLPSGPRGDTGVSGKNIRKNYYRKNLSQWSPQTEKSLQYFGGIANRNPPDGVAFTR